MRRKNTYARVTGGYLVSTECEPTINKDAITIDDCIVNYNMKDMEVVLDNGSVSGFVRK